MTEIAARLARPIQRLGRPSTVFLVAALVIAVAGVALLARAYTLRDSVLPGVSVAGVDVGGLAPADARARIDAEVGARLDEPVEIVVGGKSLRVTPSNIFQVDGAASERAAYDSARESLSARLGALAVPFAVHRDVQPVLRVHESGRAALADELAGAHQARCLRPRVHGGEGGGRRPGPRGHGDRRRRRPRLASGDGAGGPAVLRSPAPERRAAHLHRGGRTRGDDRAHDRGSSGEARAQRRGRHRPARSRPARLARPLRAEGRRGERRPRPGRDRSASSIPS